jgi:hypothetical protein
MCVHANKRLVNLKISLKDTVCVKELGHLFQVADLPSLRDLWFDVTSTSKGVFRLFTHAVRNWDALGHVVIPSSLVSRLKTLILDFGKSPRLSAHVWGLTGFLHVHGAPLLTGSIRIILERTYNHYGLVEMAEEADSDDECYWTNAPPRV